MLPKKKWKVYKCGLKREELLHNSLLGWLHEDASFAEWQKHHRDIEAESRPIQSMKMRAEKLHTDEKWAEIVIRPCIERLDIYDLISSRKKYQTIKMQR